MRMKPRQEARAPRQLELPLSRDGTRRGGRRRGSGRKLVGERRSTPHRSRGQHNAAHPVHVTMRARLGPLRSQFVYPSIRIAIADATWRDPVRFRVLQYSVQSNHVHLVVEAADARGLSSGMRSLAIRMARLVNRLLFRTGRFWADRWHGRALQSPREVRHALLYVLANFRKHTKAPHRRGIDPYSSGAYFDGWREWSPRAATAPPFASRPPPLLDRRPAVLPARSWLARVGFRRRGLISLGESPVG